MDRIFTKSLASQPSKKTVAQLLVSVSIFSFLFSWPWPDQTSPLTYYEKLSNFSWNSMQFLSVAMSKNCIFLICNGILVFLAKTSAFVRSPSPSDVHDMLQNNIGDGLQMQTEPQPNLQKHVMLEGCGDVSAEEEEGEFECGDVSADEVGEFECGDVSAEEEEGEFECCDVSGEEEEVLASVEKSDEGGMSGHGDVENDEFGNRRILDEDEDEDEDQNQNQDQDQYEGVVNAEEENDEIEKMSTEELNQKFEDFIRRMKEEFRINEAHQLIIVN